MNPGENCKVRSNDEFLGGNQWVALYKSPTGFTYTVSPRSNNKCVAVLPYRFKVGGEIEYLVHYETNPSHQNLTIEPDHRPASITGGCDKPGKTPVEIAVMELYEEGGFSAIPNEMIYLGRVRPSKASAVVNYLFAINVTGKIWYPHPGDGTDGEANEYPGFINRNAAVNSDDPMLSVLITRLEAWRNSELEAWRNSEDGTNYSS
jgi:8-oxo-dGTP pyrophosphatase MutT (NUDIX family)